MEKDMTKAIKLLEVKKREGGFFDKTELVQAYKTRGLLYMQNELLSKAFDDYKKALDLIKDMRENDNYIDENEIAEVLASRGILYFMSGEHKLASQDFKECVTIWDTLKNKGISINEDMQNTVRDLKAVAISFSEDNFDEALEHFKEGIDIDEGLRNSNQSYDKCGLADKYYFVALNHMNKKENKESIANLSRCIDLLSEKDMLVNRDNLKILSTAYLYRGEIYFEIDEVDEALEDYNKAVAIEELLQKNGVEMNSFDTMDVIRLYTGRAKVLKFLEITESAINDFITALRHYKPIFDEFPDAQEDYYFYLDRLVDCLIEENVDSMRFNNTMQEFLYSMRSVSKTEEAEAAQNSILKNLKI